MDYLAGNVQLVIAIFAQIILKSGITFGSITAILLNLLLNGVNRGDEFKEIGRR